MRFSADGKLLLAENGAGRADVIAISRNVATVTPILTGLDGPTAVDSLGNTIVVLEAKIGELSDPAVTAPYEVKELPSTRP